MRQYAKTIANQEFINNYVIFDKNTYCSSKTFNQVYVEVNGSSKGKNLTVKKLIEDSDGCVFRKSGALFGIRIITTVEKKLEENIDILKKQIEKLTEELNIVLPSPVVEKTPPMPMETPMTIEDNCMKKAIEEFEMDEEFKTGMSEELRNDMKNQILFINEEEELLLQGLNNSLTKFYSNGLSKEEKEKSYNEFCIAKQSMRDFDTLFNNEAKSLLNSLSVEDSCFVRANLMARRNIDIYFNDGKIDEEMKQLYLNDTIEELMPQVRNSRINCIYRDIIKHSN